MKNPFEKSLDNKRYYTFNCFLKNKFNTKVFKVSLNAGMTCPNRDGTKSTGGCTFCSGNLSGDFGGDPRESIRKQFDEVRMHLHKKWPEASYIAYFQAGTNTYAPVEKLRELYYSVLEFPNVVGISIATRPDCLSEEICDLLKELSQKTYLVVELGLQTIHNETDKRINRCHSYKEFLDGYEMLSSRVINICVHIINGLPGETKEMMLKTTKAVASLKPHSIKIHLLHIIKGTKMCDEYEKGGFEAMEFSDYINLVCDQLEILPPDTVVQRLTGDGDKKTLVAPLWSFNKFNVLNQIDKEMLRRNSVQGCKYLS